MNDWKYFLNPDNGVGYRLNEHCVEVLDGNGDWSESWLYINPRLLLERNYPELTEDEFWIKKLR